MLSTGRNRELSTVASSFVGHDPVNIHAISSQLYSPTMALAGWTEYSRNMGHHLKLSHHALSLSMDCPPS